MSHQLGRLLHSEGRLFEIMIDDLESATGSSAVDVNLIGRLATQANAQIRQLGFVDEKVTVSELLMALQSTYRHAMAALDESIAATDLVNQIYGSKSKEVGPVYTLSRPLLERILRVLPPTGLMRRVGVMEIDELLEKLDLDEIGVCLMETETADWQQKFNQQVASLERGYFDFLPLQIRPMSESLHKIFTDKLILYDYLSAKIFVWSSIELKYLAQLAAILQRRVLRSNQLAFILAAEHYHAQLQKWLVKESNHVWTLAGNTIPRTSFYAALTQIDAPLYRRVKAELPNLHQKINVFDAYHWLTAQLNDGFWTENEALLVEVENKIISFNLLDNYFSDLNQNLETRFAEEALWNSLIRQYLQNQNLADQLFLQLESKIKN